MRKFILIGISVILIVAMLSCKKSNKGETDSKSSMAQLYCVALDSFIPIDEALNRDMKYIAIDIDTLEISTEEEKEKIKEYFAKYQVPVIFESFNSLEEKGKVGEGNSIEGILLRVEKTEVSKKNALVEGSKFRSGVGAVGVHCELKFKDGIWEVKEVLMTWIS